LRKLSKRVGRLRIAHDQHDPGVPQRPFEGTNEALAYVETGRAKGKVVVAMK
jgi:hypothetical protein